MHGLWLFRHTISYHWLIYIIYTQEKQRNRHNDTPIDRCTWPCFLDTWKNDCASGEPGPYLLRFIGVVITFLLHLKPTFELLLSLRHGNTPQLQCGDRNALYSNDISFSCSTFCFSAILPIPVAAQSQKTCKDTSSYSNPNAKSIATISDPVWTSHCSCFDGDYWQFGVNSSCQLWMEIGVFYFAL